MAARTRAGIAPATLALIVFALAALATLAACGGGTKNPGPGPIVFPTAVDEITEADLAGADVPALPLAASAVSMAGASRRASVREECTRTESVDKNETVSIHNLTPTATGFKTDVPADTTSRIIAWALYKLPGEAGDHARSLTVNGLSGNDQLRLFAGIGNFSLGRWEPIGRIAVDPSDPSGNTYFLSPGQSYNRASDGAAYLLLVVGHPGNANVNALSLNFEEIKCTFINAPCANEGFVDRKPGTLNWGDGKVDYVGIITDADRYLVRQEFQTQAQLTSGRTTPVVLFPQPLNLNSTDSTDWFLFQSLTGDYNSDGVVDASDYAFYDPDEVNGARHPYRLGVWDDTDIVHAVGAIPLSAPAGGTTPSSIIAILIGAVGPVPAGRQVELHNESEAVVSSGTTDAKGRFELPNVDDLPGGQYTLWYQEAAVASSMRKVFGFLIPAEKADQQIVQVDWTFRF